MVENTKEIQMDSNELIQEYITGLENAYKDSKMNEVMLNAEIAALKKALLAKSEADIPS